MTSPIIWVNGDNLNPRSQVFELYPDSPAIFVFDEELLSRWQISFKRIVFMYECLLEMPVTIRKGDILREVTDFASEHTVDHIVTMDSPSPRFNGIVDGFRENQLSVEILSEIPIIDTDYRFDLKRFSRFWRKAKPYAMRFK